jgi:hypothetical protein
MLSHIFIIDIINLILQPSKYILVEEKMKQLVEIYQDDLDCSMLTAVSEIKMWQQKFVETQDLPKTTEAIIFVRLFLYFYDAREALQKGNI